MAHSQHAKPSQFELFLNPIRLRIIQLLMLKKQLTAHQIAEAEADIPLTTLYRHLNMLVDGGILAVVEEHRIRGTVERVYKLATNDVAALELGKSTEQTAEQHMQLFTMFTATLLDSFRRYLERCGTHIDFATDGVRYRQFSMHLTDEEFNTFFAELSAVIDRWQVLEPSSERTSRLLSVITMPENI